MSSTSEPERQRRGAAQVCLLIVLLLAVPFALRPLDARFGMRNVPASYLPATTPGASMGALEPSL